jgi:hypothetical protein
MQTHNIITAFLKYLPSFKLSVFVVYGLKWCCLLFRWHHIKRRKFARDTITNVGYMNIVDSEQNRRSEILHLIWVHALCMLCSPNSHLGNIKAPCRFSHKSTRIMFYHLNNVSFPIDVFIKLTLSCNSNIGNCTGISRYLVNKN